jgi:lipid-A-disaccharide synthase
MKYFLIAGEASGDLHGANLMHSIKSLDAHAEFHYYGGDLMQAQGGTLLKHYSEMAFMGFVEVLANLQTINQNLAACKAAILKAQPDVLVLIDYPGFNLRMAAYAKSIGIKVSYFISPKIWAWNQGRVHKIKQVVDQMLCILPFEVAFYKKFAMDVVYVGNPLKDAISN